MNDMTIDEIAELSRTAQCHNRQTAEVPGFDEREFFLLQGSTSTYKFVDLGYYLQCGHFGEKSTVA